MITKGLSVKIVITPTPFITAGINIVKKEFGLKNGLSRDIQLDN